MGITRDIAYVKFIVHRWLWDKKELQIFREDLEQEGMIALLQSHGKYDPSYGQDEDLWRHYQVHNALRKYVERKEVRHFKKPETDHDSPYWNLNDPVLLDDLESEDDIEYHRSQLLELTYGVEFTERQAQVLELVMEDRSFPYIGEVLGISRQRAEQSYQEVVTKIRKANDL